MLLTQKDSCRGTSLGCRCSCPFSSFILHPIKIENFLKEMRRDGRSDSYISKARGMPYQIFQKAEANDLARRNLVRLAEKMRASNTAKRKEAFTTAEVAHLMKVLPDDRRSLSIRQSAIELFSEAFSA